MGFVQQTAAEGLSWGQEPAARAARSARDAPCSPHPNLPREAAAGVTWQHPASQHGCVWFRPFTLPVKLKKKKFKNPLLSKKIFPQTNLKETT